MVSFSQARVLASSAQPPHRSTTVSPSTVEQNEAPTSVPFARLVSNASRTAANLSRVNPPTDPSVKIEPLAGETTRGHPKARFKAFDFVNRNKRSIAVDMARPQGADAIRRLAKDADLFVENYRPGALERMGLGYQDLAKINPRLVYVSVSGFGQTGPYRDRGGFDLIAQAMSGIMSFTGEPGARRPTACGVPLSDLNAGTFAALGA